MSRSRAGAALTLAAVLAIAGPASGQGRPGSGFGPPGGFAPPGGSSKKKAPKKPEEETHAASNTEAQQSLQTQEPQLPPDPTAIPKDVKERIGTDFSRDLEKGRGPTIERDYYGLYYQEKSGGYRFQTLLPPLPPLWMQRDLPEDRASIFGFYYNRRGKDHSADVAFPFYWRLRDKNVRTTVVLPFVHREADPVKDKDGNVVEPGRHDNWVVPLAFSGESDDGHGYLHVPALFTVTQHSARGGLNVVGPMYCKWKGGPACDRRTADVMDLGLPPFYFWGKDETSEYEFILPLLHYYKYSEVGDKSTNLWGPILLQHTPDKETVDVMPFVFRSWGKNEASTTVFPFFHYQYKGASSLLVTPLFVTAKGDDGSSTIASWLYAKYRGRTELDMYTPFYWQYRDPDIGLDRKLFFPFYYSNSSPRSKDMVVFPFYGRFQRAGLSDQTWITPFFRHVGDVTGWETDIFPAIWFGRRNDSTHTVVAPFLWDFTSPHSRITVVAPLYVRIVDDKSIFQVAGNTLYREKEVPGGIEWEFHFLPLFSYGESPVGHWWNVLFGLAGYTREGTMSKIRTFYIPIKLTD